MALDIISLAVSKQIATELVEEAVTSTSTDFSEKLAAEESRAKLAEAGLQNQINVIIDNPDAEGIINSISEFTKYIETHGSVAEGFNASIQENATAISSEVSRATAAEATLQAQLDTINDTSSGILATAKAYVDGKNLDQYTTDAEVRDIVESYNYLTEHQDISGKQDVISDLDEIRAGAALGKTAIQAIPEEYITETELTAKSYATEQYVTSSIDEAIAQHENLAKKEEVAKAKEEVLTEITTIKEEILPQVKTELLEEVDNVKQEIIPQVQDVAAKIDATQEWVKAQKYLQDKYEVLPIEGMFVDYRGTEIRLNTQRVTPVRQEVGSTGNPNMYYATFRAYAPEGATGVIESDGSQTDAEPTILSTDSRGRKYTTIWSAIANTSDGETWSKWGDKSTLDKYLGFYYTFTWYKEDEVIGIDKVRIILTNDSCHTDLVPDPVARRIDDKAKAILSVVENTDTNLSDALENEQIRAKNAEAALQNQIDLLVENPDVEGTINSIKEFTKFVEDHGDIVTGLQTDIKANQDAINTEIVRAQKAEDALTDEINNRISALYQNSEIDIKFEEVNKAISDEASRIKAIEDDYLTAEDKYNDTEIRSLIASEVTRATEIEASLRSDIDLITSDYLKVADIADFETKENVKKVADDLAAHKEDADAAIADRYTKDAADVKFAVKGEDAYNDTEVRNLISAETQRAEGIESGIRADVNSIKADYLKTADKDDLQGNIDTVNAAVERLTNGVSSEEVDSVNDLIQYVKDHGPEVTGIKEDIQANADDIEALSGRMNTAEGDIDAIEADLTEYKETVTNALAGKQDVITENTYDVYGSASQALIDAKAYVDGLAGNYDVSGAAAQALTDATLYIDGEVDKLEAKDAELVAEGSRLAGLISGNASEIGNVRMLAQQGVDNAATAQSAADNARDEVDTLKGVVSTLRSEYDGTKALATANEAAIGALGTRISTTEDKIADLETESVKHAEKTYVEEALEQKADNTTVEAKLTEAKNYTTENFVSINKLPDYLAQYGVVKDGELPDFALVATSGDYNDLINKPELFSGSYSDLTDKPAIPSIEGLATEEFVGNAIANIEFPETDISGKADVDHKHDDLYEVKGAAEAVKDELLNGAGAAYDTLKELGDLINENVNAIDALELIAADKADKNHTHEEYLTEHQSLTGYATEQWVEAKNYLTEHQDISDKADKTYVDEELEKKVNVTDYTADKETFALKSELYNDEALTNRIATVEADVASRAVKAEVEEALDLKADKSEIPSIAGLASEDFVGNAIANIEFPETDLSGYYTKDEVDFAIAAIEHPANPTKLSELENDTNFVTIADAAESINNSIAPIVTELNTHTATAANEISANRTNIANLTNSFNTHVSKTESAVDSNTAAINTLTGTGEGSVDKKISDAINNFATSISDDDTVNTYKELIDYAANHGAEFTELVGTVSGNTNAISSNAVDIQSLRADINAMLTEIATLTRKVTQMEDVALYITNEDENVIIPAEDLERYFAYGDSATIRAKALESITDKILLQLQAKFTSGQNAGTTIQLARLGKDDKTGHGYIYELSNIIGKCELSGVWFDKQWTPTWSAASNGTLQNGINNIVVDYGTGLAAVDMPYAIGKGSETGTDTFYKFNGWSVSGEISDLDGNITTFSNKNYIPTDAISATATAQYTTVSNVRNRAGELGKEYTITVSSSNSAVQHRICPYGALASDGYITSGVQTVNSKKGFGFSKVGKAISEQYVWNGLMIPVTFDGEIAYGLKTGKFKASDLTITVTADVHVGASKASNSDGRSSAWVDIDSNLSNVGSNFTWKQASVDSGTIETNFTPFNGAIVTVVDDATLGGDAVITVESNGNTSYSTTDSTVTRTAGTSNTDGFKIGFCCAFYTKDPKGILNNNHCNNYALIENIKYKVSLKN